MVVQPVIAMPAACPSRMATQAPTADADQITAVHLLRLGSVTHGFNQNQRIARLRYAQGDGKLWVLAPADPNLCPPGDYLLFLISADGVPSLASCASKTSNFGVQEDGKTGRTTN